MSSLLSRTLEGVKEQAQGGRTDTNGNSRPRRSDTAPGTRHSPYAVTQPMQRPRDDEAWSHDMYERKSAPTAHTNVDSFAGGRRAQGYGVPSARLKITNVHYDISEDELKVGVVPPSPVEPIEAIKSSPHVLSPGQMGACAVLTRPYQRVAPQSQALFGQIGPISIGPKIIFDASGRSTGRAFVTYSDERNAEEAMHAFQGAPCKGEKIRLEYDYFLDNTYTRGQAAPGTLLARIDDDKGRRSKGDMERYAPPAARSDPPSGRYARGSGVHSSSHRDDRASNGSSRGVRAVGVTRGGRGGGSGSGGSRPPRKEPKTADDLDRELDSYLKQADSEPSGQATSATAAPVASEVPEVEMS
ncbi:BZ3500_MvSof-1268-A1-R1_Chr5-3g08245 [Microbotryum saponariae]|uniref:BZ3500_MvSof-1268-A1-R1_Chr5-3g08245 protein n=1 Tax=Microbotryum saponariae TaxID=289078 RepID=A0A2X0KH62_9BASI|nr:BZ3500_MvSof-1268-A1-R1_Chr5-3g08245 [Microbotryum saponariae]SDA08353.1 BZ3501_MvSof-1269-A2-R1_Chr5-3g07973 [Microbotryum saponariae]